MGYSLSVASNIPFAEDVHTFMRDAAVEFSVSGTQSYSAIGLVGFNGYFAFRHMSSGEMAAYTLDLGNITEFPDFDLSDFAARVEKISQRPGLGATLVSFANEYVSHPELSITDYIKR